MTDAPAADADPRVAPVEGNLLEFLGAIAAQPNFGNDVHDDVVSYHSPVAFPLFNGIVGARFAPDRARERAREVLRPYLERGRPFLWWTTPSTTSPELEEALGEAGLQREDVPGMYADLAGPVPAPAPPGEITVVGRAQLRAFCDVMVAGYEMPAELASEFHVGFAGFDERLVNVIASVDGRPAACGTVWLTGQTAGIYDVATLPEARGRGLGHAVTAALMEIGRERGATHAILHATEMGRPVYERLGFTEVCTVPQYLWLPRG